MHISLSTNLQFDRIIPDLGGLGLSNLVDISNFQEEVLLSDSLNTQVTEIIWKKHFTHAIVIHVLQFIALTDAFSNLSSKVTCF